MARPANSSVVAYAPEQVAEDPKTLHRYLHNELIKIQASINSLAEQGAYTTVEPSKPRDGMIRLADGTAWDPVSTGSPTYVGYRDGAWVSLE